MTTTAWFIFYVFGIYVFLLFGHVMYVAIMAVKRIEKDLHPFARWNYRLLVLPVGLVWDAMMNLLVCLALWWKPRDWLLTGTLQRIRYETPAGSKREAVAAWICNHLLNQFDPSGKHC